MKLNDPEQVRREYATETGLTARKAAYQHAEGPNAQELVFQAIAAARPSRFLDVGCGEGELAARVQHELRAEVVAIDQSERMVELTRARGVDARVGDVQELPVADTAFDCAAAAWMLYHVPDVDQALDELARVLRVGGRLVAVTNYGDHLQELKELVGAPEGRFTTFRGEDAEPLLRARFANVERIDCSGTVTFPDRDAVLAYVRPSVELFGEVEDVRELEAPLVVRRRPVIFVATK